ncbi:MAG TPA: hypothetical protein VNX18_10910 [Bryobacteraceae bacterium]|nr:hypothetical protein [Bryobacteraceae bacterium]
MKYLLIAVSMLAYADKKPLPGQAGNDDIELVGSVIVDRDEVKQALGADLGAGYVAVRMKVTPKTEKPLRISPDDFTIVSRKDGQRSEALSPGQIAGRGALVVKAAPNQPGGLGTTTNGPIWGGIGGAPRQLPGNRNGVGNSAGADGGVEAKTESDGKQKDEPNPLLDILKAKQLPDKETLETQEGLLYFPIDGKIKPKDLAVIYKGPAGKLVMEFANPK